MRHIIVGVDPGKMAAIACLDLEGRLVHLKSERFAGFGWFVSQIKGVGVPVIIASDKKNSPQIVSKISAAFGSRLFFPEQDISVREKEQITNKMQFANLHERDALAAALVAYKSYSHKFNQAEKLARETNYENIDNLKAMVVKKYSIHETITGKKTGKRK